MTVRRGCDGRRCATVATGPRACRADRRRRRRSAGGRAHAQPAPRADRIPARPIRAIRAAIFCRRRARRARGTRSASAASSSRSWCAGARRATISRSSPASGAGARRSAPACTTCRSSCSRSATREALELAIIENVQRADLNPLEEAAGYQALADEFSYSQDDIAKIVGKSRSHVANTLRLLKLSDAVQGLHPRRQAHRRPCAHADRPAQCRRAGGGRSSSAASTCARSRRWRARAASSRRREVRRTGAMGKDADTVALEKRLSDALGLVVTHRASRQRRRRAADPLPHARAARRRGTAAGERPEKSRHRYRPWHPAHSPAVVRGVAKFVGWAKARSAGLPGISEHPCVLATYDVRPAANLCNRQSAAASPCFAGMLDNG